MPLTGGEVEELLTFKSDDWSVVAVSGRRIMLLVHDWEKAAYKAVVYDVDSKSRRELEVPFIDGNRRCDSVVGQGERMYLCREDGVHWLDMNGESGTVPVRWPEGLEVYGPNIDYRAEDMVGDRLMASVGWCSGYEASTLARRFMVDLQTGELKEAPLQYRNGKEYFLPVEVLGQSKDSLLVRFESQVRKHEFIQPNGVPTQGEMEVCRYGMISLEDYLAGNVNYREFSMSFDSYWM